MNDGSWEQCLVTSRLRLVPATRAMIQHELRVVETDSEHRGTVDPEKGEQATIAGTEIKDATPAARHVIEQDALAFGAARVLIGSVQMAKRVAGRGPLVGGHAVQHRPSSRTTTPTGVVGVRPRGRRQGGGARVACRHDLNHHIRTAPSQTRGPQLDAARCCGRTDPFFDDEQVHAYVRYSRHTLPMTTVRVVLAEDQPIVGAASAQTHVSRILMKLGARDRVQLVVMAYQTGLVEA